MAFPFPTSACQGGMNFPPHLVLAARQQGRSRRKNIWFSIIYRNVLSYRMTQFFASGQELDHNIFYRPAKFTNLTPLVIEALYCTE